MRHVSKLISLSVAAAVLAWGTGVGLAAPFWWIAIPAQAQKIQASTAWSVVVNATTTDPAKKPIGIYLEWQQKVGASWNGFFAPTGANWGATTVLSIPVSSAYFVQTGLYRIRAQGIMQGQPSAAEWTPWREFEIVKSPKRIVIPEKELHPIPKPIPGPPPVQK